MVWKSNEVYPVWVTPICVFGFPQSNDFQTIKTYENQPLPNFLSLLQPDGVANYEQNRNKSYQRLIPEAKDCRLRPLAVLASILSLIFYFLINKFIN